MGPEDLLDHPGLDLVINSGTRAVRVVVVDGLGRDARLAQG